MSTQVQRRRGNTAQHAGFIGAVGETTYDSDFKRLVAHDGLTLGGLPAAHLHVANIFSQPQTIAVASGAPTIAFDIQTDSVSRVTFRKSGFGVFHRQEADVSPGGIELTKRGTTGNALAALSSGSAISTIDWLGWDGAALGGAGGIRMFTNQAWTGAAHGSKLFFTTVPAGSTSTVNSMELDNTALTVLSRLLLPNTTSATVGGIYFGGNRVFHNFGTNNIFAGASAGNLTMTGSANSFFGDNAGPANTSGSSNSFFGTFAGLTNTSGGSNSFFGRNAGQQNTTGANNSILGTSAGASNQTGSNNSIFGRSAGGSNTGSNNSLFGYQAGDNLTTGSNNIVLGYDIDSPTATNSNTLTIGNLIFGTGVDGTGTTISSGNIGIGVITPLTKFHTVGTGRISGLTQIGSQTAGTGLIVGSQTAALSSLGSSVGLDVYASGNANFSGFNFINEDTGTSAGLAFQWILTNSAGTKKRAAVFTVFKGDTWASAATEDSMFNIRLLNNGVDEIKLRMVSSGDLALGDFTPLARLHVGGGIYMATAGALSVASGANQRAGNLTLIAGTLTVANTTVTANSILMLTRKTSGGTIGTAITYTTTAATSFTVTSDSVLDTSTFSYMLIEVP